MESPISTCLDPLSGGLGGPWSVDGHRERGDDASGQNLEIPTSIATPSNLSKLGVARVSAFRRFGHITRLGH